MKQTIRLNEGELHSIIKESVKRVLMIEETDMGNFEKLKDVEKPRSVINENTKQDVLDKVTALGRALMNEEVHDAIRLIGELKIDTQTYSPIVGYIREIILRTLTEKVSQMGGKFQVTRHGEYNTPNTDYYEIEDGVLNRNGTNAKFTSLGKLYQAYKTIIPENKRQ